MARSLIELIPGDNGKGKECLVTTLMIWMKLGGTKVGLVS
jgi:hypothetical protein